MTIDIHAHCVPAGVLETLTAEGGRYGIEIVADDGKRRALIAGRVEVGPLRPDLTDVGRRLAAMDAAGVEVQVLSSWIDMTAYALPPAAGVRYARMFNEALAATVEQQPERFKAVCTVPLQAAQNAADELRHAVTALGMVGVEIATTVDGRELDDPELEPFWTAAEDLRAIVLIHPYESLAGRGISRYFLGNLVGNPAETTVALAHIVFGGVLERHPDLQLCLVHGGGFAPFQAGRWDRGFRVNARGAAQHLTRPPSHWLRRLYYDSVLHSPASLRFLIDLVGAEHVVLGSDYPFEMGDDRSVATVAAVPGLGDDERRLILSGNLERLLDGIRR